MHAEDILFYGHRSFKRSLRGLAESDRETKGLCGIWSGKDVIAHLAAYELVISEVLGSFNSLQATPNLDRFRAGNFNDSEVEARRSMTHSEALQEYEEARKLVSERIKLISLEKMREKETVDWFGKKIDLEDFIVFVGYGHKREHAAQFNAFKDQLKA